MGMSSDKRENGEVSKGKIISAATRSTKGTRASREKGELFGRWGQMGEKPQTGSKERQIEMRERERAGKLLIS